MRLFNFLTDFFARGSHHFTFLSFSINVIEKPFLHQLILPLIYFSTIGKIKILTFLFPHIQILYFTISIENITEDESICTYFYFESFDMVGRTFSVYCAHKPSKANKPFNTSLIFWVRTDTTYFLYLYIKRIRFIFKWYRKLRISVNFNW